MNNLFLIADNNDKDIFEIEIPDFDTNSEIKADLPVKHYPDGFALFTPKSIIFVGIVILSVIIISIIFLLKKRQQNNIPLVEPEEQATESVSKTQKEERYTKKFSSLKTPNSLNDCIRSFLERTKND